MGIVAACLQILDMEAGLSRAKEIDLKMLSNELTELEGKERVGNLLPVLILLHGRCSVQLETASVAVCEHSTAKSLAISGTRVFKLGCQSLQRTHGLAC